MLSFMSFISLIAFLPIGTVCRYHFYFNNRLMGGIFPLHVSGVLRLCCSINHSILSF